MSTPNSPGTGSNASNKVPSNHSEQEVSAASQHQSVTELPQPPPTNAPPSSPNINDSVSKPSSPLSASSPQNPSPSSNSPPPPSSPVGTSYNHPHNGSSKQIIESSSPPPLLAPSRQESNPTPNEEEVLFLSTPNNLSLQLSPGLSADHLKKLSWRPTGLSEVIQPLPNGSEITEVISPHHKESTSSKESTLDRGSLKMSHYQSVRGRRNTPIGPSLEMLPGYGESTILAAAAAAAAAFHQDPSGEEVTQENSTTSQQQLPVETKEDKIWMLKLEQFAVKFFNKIFRRRETERKMKAAVKMPNSCKNETIYGRTVANETMDPPPEYSQEEEEFALSSELDSMLDEIAEEVIKPIPSSYVTLINPIFASLVDLKYKDFQKTDNREIFRKVDDYEALIKCDSHICLNSVIARVQTLAKLVNDINADSEVLKKFPRIITKCYSTKSKICQEICEVYSNEDFQTVNIKKMCKLKPQPTERPPWRLSFKVGNGCCRDPKDSDASSNAKGCKFTTENSSQSTIPNDGCDSCPFDKDKELKKRTMRRFWSALNAVRNPYPVQSFTVAPCCKSRICNCGCCTPKALPKVGGLLYTRFRANNLDPEECPLTVDGYGTGEDLFPSVTNFKSIRVLNHPGNHLFAGGEPKCCNPPPVPENCFGTGMKWNQQFPCGNRNTCCQDPCKPLRDKTCYPRCGAQKSGILTRRSSRGVRMASSKFMKGDFNNEIATSTTNLGETPSSKFQEGMGNPVGGSVTDTKNVNGNCNISTLMVATQTMSTPGKHVCPIRTQLTMENVAKCYSSGNSPSKPICTIKSHPNTEANPTCDSESASSKENCLRTGIQPNKDSPICGTNSQIPSPYKSRCGVGVTGRRNVTSEKIPPSRPVVREKTGPPVQSKTNQVRTPTRSPSRIIRTTKTGHGNKVSKPVVVATQTMTPPTPKKHVCRRSSQPSKPGIARCSSKRKSPSKPICTRKSEPSIDGIPTCYSDSVCTTRASKVDKNMPLCAKPESPPLPEPEELPPPPEEFQDEDVAGNRTPSMSEKESTYMEEEDEEMRKSFAISDSPPKTPSNNNSPEKSASPVESELSWPKAPKKISFPKRPSKKPGEDYTSPFKFKQIKPPPPTCEVEFAELPECHPLKTAYPPQFRYNEMRLRKYMEQCDILKRMCSTPNPQQDQSNIPESQPASYDRMPNEFPPPDRCNGNCYYPYDKVKSPVAKPNDDCYFDCGGICPMGLLGETCPKPPPYTKLKKKKKEDETFTFDYITVRREKNGNRELEEKEYCDIYKEKIKDLENERRGRRMRDEYCVDDYKGAGPSDEIARFLKRRDVQVVKEQKTEIVKKYTEDGPARLVTQMETYYTKTPDGKINVELKGPGNINNNNNNNNNFMGVEQWVREDVNKDLKKFENAYRCPDECPRLETDWEKEFKEFEMSCNRPKVKVKAQQRITQLPRFVQCPIPNFAPVLCGNPVGPTNSGRIVCQGFPFPFGNRYQIYGSQAPNGLVGGGGACPIAPIAPVSTGLYSMPPPPPEGYGGYVLQPQLTQMSNLLPASLAASINQQQQQSQLRNGQLSQVPNVLPVSLATSINQQQHMSRHLFQIPSVLPISAAASSSHQQLSREPTRSFRVMD